MVSEDSLKKELMKNLKPLKHIQIDFENDVIILRLLYSKGKRGSYATIQYKREKWDSLEKIFDHMRTIISKEYLETHL